MSRHITPQEIKGLFTDDKTPQNLHPYFHWKVDLTYIMRNFPSGNLKIPNLQSEETK